MNSIRVRLFAILLATTTAVWLFAVIWIYQSTQSQVEHVLDARLTEAARMVSSLITDHRIDVAAAIDAATKQAAAGEQDVPEDSYKRQLSCQIWSLEGVLVGRSESAPAVSLATHEDGFAETDINGERWRVFAVVNPNLGVRVLVGDSLQIRDRLVGDVIKGLLLPALVILPLLAALIWLSVGRGLAPLNRIAASLGSRGATDLQPLADLSAPLEVKPMTTALNKLFLRVADARDRERNFTAYAAHELKTPLAGLKTQAQIALRSEDQSIQQAALKHIITSVDRTSRMVRQLIDMAIVDSQGFGTAKDLVALTPLLADLKNEMNGLLKARNVELDIGGDEDGHWPTVLTNEMLFRLSLRNVIENAIQHSSSGAAVLIRVSVDGDQLRVVVSDQGPGIELADLGRVTERFYRGSHHVSTGSGLGLSIVQMSLDRIGADLQIENKTDGGLVVSILMPTESPYRSS